MSNAAQTWTIIGATVGLIGVVVTALSFWIAHSLAAMRGEMRELRGDLREIRGDLREMRTELLRDHGERIARLEDRSGISSH
jgi:hypothetical protein